MIHHFINFLSGHTFLMTNTPTAGAGEKDDRKRLRQPWFFGYLLLSLVLSRCFFVILCG